MGFEIGPLHACSFPIPLPQSRLHLSRGLQGSHPLLLRADSWSLMRSTYDLPTGSQCDSLASQKLIGQLVTGDVPAYFPLFPYWESVAIILEDKENSYHLFVL